MRTTAIPGIGPAMHRVVWIEITRTPIWKRPRLEIRAACGMKLMPPGDLYRPQVAEVTCTPCLSETE
jgi:hypothetical protein